MLLTNCRLVNSLMATCLAKKTSIEIQEDKILWYYKYVPTYNKNIVYIEDWRKITTTSHLWKQKYSNTIPNDFRKNTTIH